MSLLVGAVTAGLILSLAAMGVLVSFRVLDFPDITSDGSFALGGAVAASALTAGVDPAAASALALAAGACAGALTGTLHTRLGIRPILAGILMMTALYSINLHVMGRSNISLLDTPSLLGWAAAAVRGVQAQDAAMLAAVLLLVALVALLLRLFFLTHVGSAMRATGNNAQMVRALGVGTDAMIVAGLALSNGLIALSGAVLAQYQGFADIQMGVGAFVWGIASLIIGETLVGARGVGAALAGTVFGSVVFRGLIALALQWGMNPNDLKLITAAFVLAALGLPVVMKRARGAPGSRHA